MRMFLAALTQAAHFDRGMLDTEAEFNSARFHRTEYTLGVHLLGVAAALAHQEQRSVWTLRVDAGKIGVAAGKAVHQTLLQQEIQRTVNCRWRCRTTAVAQFVEQLIGTDRLIGTTHQFQHQATQFGETLITLGAQVFGLTNQHADLS
jgi:hypothetical protein